MKTVPRRLRLENLEDRWNPATLLQTLYPDPAGPQPTANLGHSTATDGTYLVAGASNATAAGFTSSGEVYVFDAATGNLLTKLVNPSPGDADNFGVSVSVSGGIVAVGAFRDDSDGFLDNGRAYVFNAATGALISTLVNPDPTNNDWFGASVAVSGNTVVVGAPRDDNGGTDSGAAYVFDATTGTRLQTILNPTAAFNDQFGASVAVSGNTVVVGAAMDDTVEANNGRAYVFDAVSGGLTATLINPSGGEDQFGNSVAVSGNTVVVGSPLNDTGATDSGASHVFNAATGALVRTLVNPFPNATDWFGAAVAVSGNTVVVSANRDDTGASDSGQAYVFDAVTGDHAATLPNPTPAATDTFSHSVAVSGNVIMVGTPNDDTEAIDSGAAYVFDPVGNLVRTLANPTPAAGDQFGYSTALSGNTLVAGSYLDDTGALNSGRVYVHHAITGELMSSFVNPSPGNGDQFGSAVAVSGNTVVVGAQLDDTGFVNNGRVYVFDAVTGNLLHTLANPVPAAGDQFGIAVAVSGNWIVVGSNGNGTATPNAGQVYVFDAVTGNLARTIPNPTPAASEYFGLAVAVSGDNILVGAHGVSVTGVTAGQAYVVNALNGNLLHTLNTPSPDASDRFGHAVAVSGNTAVVSALWDDTGGSDSGQAYVFDIATGAFVTTLPNPSPAVGDNFGHSVSVSGTTVVVGSRFDDTAASNSGQAYVFDSVTGSLIDTLANPTPFLSDQFGFSVAVSGKTIVVGAALESTQNWNQGAVYVHTQTVAPTDISIDANTVAENQPTGTTVGSFSTTDADVGDTFTYSLVSGTGDTHNSSFVIDGNILKTTSGFNFEAGSGRTVRVRSTDAVGFFTEKEFAITVTNVNEPPANLALGNASVAENATLGSAVGSFSATDPDTGDTLAYALVAGAGDTDNGKFLLSPAGALTTNALFDFEVKNSHTVRVRTTDVLGLFVESDFTVTITDANDAPTDLALNNTTVNENLSVGATVGTLSTTDQDGGDSFIYTFTTGDGDADNGSFTLDGNLLKTDASFNFEAKSGYSVRVRTTDAVGAFIERRFDLTVANVNEQPTALGLGNATINENSALGSAVGSFTATDPDTGDTFTYALTSGDGDTDNAKFLLSSAGALTTNSLFDFETKSAFTIRVLATDFGGLSFENTFAITVNDVNDPPTGLALSNATVSENQLAGAAVGSLTTTDEDTVDTFTYTLVNGDGDADNGSFVVDGDVLRTDTSFNREAKSAYSVRVRSEDAGGSFTEKEFSITVTNVNEQPTDVTLSNATVDENAAIGAAVGGFTTADPDTGETFTYSFVSGDGDTDNARFSLSTAGALTTNAVFDFETKASYSIRVIATDLGGLSVEKSFVITVDDVNDAPTDVTLGNATVNENLPPATAVGFLTTADADSGDTFTYTLVTGDGDTDNGSFALDGDVLRTGATFDHEAKSGYSVRVRSTDAIGTFTEKEFAIAVTNVNEPPANLALSNATINENSPLGTAVGSFSSDDPDTGDTRGYSLVTGDGDTDNAKFLLSPAGALTTNALFDFEVKNSHTVRVRVTDALGLFVEKDFAITIVDANDAPTVLALNNTTVNENLSMGATVGTLSTTDQDGGDSFIYTFSTGDGDADNGSFTLDGNVLKTAASFNFEAKNSYSVRVRSTDALGLFVEKDFVIAIADVNDPPGILTLGNSTVNENLAAGATVGTFTTSDQDSGDTFAYSLADGDGDEDNTSFSLSSAGLLTTSAAFDFETKCSYSVRVKSTDAAGASVEESFVITVTDVNDRPVIDTEPGVIVEIIPANATVLYGASIGALVTNATDEDANANIFRGVAITGIPSQTDKGVWEYTTDGGANWPAIPAVSDISAVLLANLPTTRVRFRPAAKFTGFAPALSFKAWDRTTGTSGAVGVDTTVGTAFSLETEKASAAVGKTVPVVDPQGNPQLTNVMRDNPNPAGDQVKSLLGLLALDSDKKNVLGMAVTAADQTNGNWQYQSAGKWVGISGVSDASALLLGPATKVRFVPDGGFFGEATLGYHAWDQTVGKIGERAVIAGDAFSVGEDVAEVNVVTKPTLDLSAERTLTTPFVLPVGVLLTGSVSDTGSNPVGIAVTGLTGKGAWSYRLGTAAPAAITKATLASALLLPGNATLLFDPQSPTFAGATLSYRAWNSNTLPARPGDRANASGAAFSAAAETLTVPGTPGINAAPQIGDDDISLGTIPEDPKTNAGVTVKGIVTLAKITDTNKTDKKGIALTAANNTNGTWQYSLDGKTWVDAGEVTPDNALALSDTAKLRFVPDGDYFGNETVAFRAWDGTAGTAGDKVDSTTGTAFSAGEATGMLQVLSVNDSPTLNTTGAHFLPFIASGGTSANVAVADLAADADDLETPANVRIAITAAAGPGKWKVRLDDLATFTDLPPLPALLPLTAVLHFVGAADKKGLATLTYQAWDHSSGVSPSKLKLDALSVAKETLTVAVGNDAPSLTGPGTLAALKEDPTSNPGQTVAKLLGATFKDTAVGKKGIAVTGIDDGGIGEWQFTINAGKTWRAITSVSETASRLLPDTATLRFVPGKNDHSVSGAEPSITYKAWDQTVGSPGETIDTTDTALNAFSATPGETATITVAGVFDAPALDTTRTPVLNGTVGSLITGAASSPEPGVGPFGIAVTGLTGKGVWEYSLDNFASTIAIMNVSPASAVVLSPAAALRFVPTNNTVPQTATLSYKAWDTVQSFTGKANTTAAANKNFFSTAVETLTVTIGNHAPTLEGL